MAKELKRTFADEFAQMSIRELLTSVTQMKADLYELKLGNHLKADKQTHNIPLLKKNIARAKQVLHDKFKK